MTQLRAKRSTLTAAEGQAMLLAVRDETVERLGVDRYASVIAAYQERITAPGGKTITIATAAKAAERALRSLGASANDPAVARLVTCAAVELALAS